jgi:exopolysaccharide production protein ExoY
LSQNFRDFSVSKLPIINYLPAQLGAVRQTLSDHSFKKVNPMRFSARVEEIDRLSSQDRATTDAEQEPLGLKRALDIAGAIAGLVIFAPTMLIIYTILIFSGGSPIFAHRRVGKGGELFYCYKFRSMVRNADRVLAEHLKQNPAARDEWDRTFKLARDPRVTRFGLFLRRSSLDELPQFFNVLKGDMSLVGPRPIVPSEIERYSGSIEAYYRCRPGITGLWQVSGRNDVDYGRRVRLDTVYARKQSVRLDIVILFRTVRVVLTGRGAY